MGGGMRAVELAKPRFGTGVTGLCHSDEPPTESAAEVERAVYSSCAGANEKALLIPDWGAIASLTAQVYRERTAS